MSDVYIPGVSSRFNTDKIVEGLMKIERIPKDRSEKDKENLQAQKAYWQEMNNRIRTLRESARQLFSFQNPFNDRVVTSSDSAALTGTASRQTSAQSKEFTVKQIAQADRFLSAPQEESFKVDAGTYTFSSGADKISFDFKGGALKDFADALTRRGKGKVEASLVTIKKGTKSLLVEAKTPGADNKIVFSDAAVDFALKIGLVERAFESIKDVEISEDTVKDISPPDAGNTTKAVESVKESIQINALGNAFITFPEDTAVPGRLILALETATKVRPTEALPDETPPPGPSVPKGGSVDFNGIVIDNDPSSVPIPEWKPPEPPVRIDDMNVLSVDFSDGTSLELSPLEDSIKFTRAQYEIPDTEAGKTIAGLTITNKNTHRDILIQRIQIIDPNDPGSLKPKNPVSTAQDAVVSMDGITITRPTNTIDDILPGVTITAKKASAQPVQIEVEADKETIKNAIISFVGNYNRLMAEINVLTRNDDRIIQELSYLSPDEQTELRKRMGAFSNDSALIQFKNALQNAATSPYIIASGTAMLAQFGIGTDMRMSGGGGAGYDPSRLRGYLEIDEKKLDEALSARLTQAQQLFGYDANGDMIVDSGVAYAFDNLSKPYVETGGLISLKIATLDSKIKADDKRINDLDKQLAVKEAALKAQYSQMENAYNRMEQMSNSLDNLKQQNNGR